MSIPAQWLRGAASAIAVFAAACSSTTAPDATPDAADSSAADAATDVDFDALPGALLPATVGLATDPTYASFGLSAEFDVSSEHPSTFTVASDGFCRTYGFQTYDTRSVGTVVFRIGSAQLSLPPTADTGAHAHYLASLNNTNPMVQAGSVVRASAPGDYFPAFDVSVSVPSSVRLESVPGVADAGATVTLDAASPLTLRWQSANSDFVKFYVFNSASGNTPPIQYTACYFPASSLTADVPSAVLRRYVGRMGLTSASISSVNATLIPVQQYALRMRAEVSETYFTLSVR